MAVFQEELEGSPTYNVTRRGATSTRMVKIAWDDIDDFMDELFTPGQPIQFAQSPYYETLLVESFAIEPMPPPLITSVGGLNTYGNGAKFTINYAVPDFEVTGDGFDNFGIDEGSVPATVPGIYYTYRGSIGAEFLTLQNSSLKWAVGDDSTVRTDLGAALTIPHISHQIDWHFIKKPPWGKVRLALGTLNAFTFANAPKGTVLFTGLEFDRPFNRLEASKLFELKYRFSERNLGDIVTPDLNIFADGAIGWNWFYRADPGHKQWEVLVSTDGEQIFEYTDFIQLFQELT